jgi:hypothetical protein
VKVKTVDLTTSLESLSYYLARPQSSAVTNYGRKGQKEDLTEISEHEL